MGGMAHMCNKKYVTSDLVPRLGWGGRESVLGTGRMTGKVKKDGQSGIS